jgi:hypothetical protein
LFSFDVNLHKRCLKDGCELSGSRRASGEWGRLCVSATIPLFTPSKVAHNPCGINEPCSSALFIPIGGPQAHLKLGCKLEFRKLAVLACPSRCQLPDCHRSAKWPERVSAHSPILLKRKIPVADWDVSGGGSVVSSFQGCTTCPSLLAALEGICNLCFINMLRGFFGSIDQTAGLGFCSKKCADPEAPQ